MSRRPRKPATEPPAITTTAAAILGLIAVQPGSAYDLAQRMKMNHRFIWPRAESKLYEEVKRLHTSELVEGEHESVGRRPRTVYRILPLGKRALAAWLSRPSEPPSLSFETLVKLAYADYGNVDDARAQVGAVAELATKWVALGRSLATMYLDDQVDLPERMRTNVLVWRFLAEYALALLTWSDAVKSTLERWDDPQAARDLFRDGLRRFDEMEAKRKRRRKS